MSHPAVAIVHYHLRRGGVTRVIETNSASLTEADIPHLILSSTLPEKGSKLPVRLVKELAYKSEGIDVTGEQIVNSLRQAAREAFGDQRPIWHFHNHSLGKSRAFSDAVGILAESGDPMILQYHDFAEDGRPDNYSAIADRKTLYPYAPQILHAFINSRDRQHLIAAGLPASQTALLPNPVTPPAHTEAHTSHPTHPLVLYPVRGIRRKNLGELFLLAALAPKGTRFAVSLAPENPHWNAVHSEWSAFANETGLPVLLAAVGRLPPVPNASTDYASWLRHSTHFVTTSIAEGFGLGFLEPATIGKPLLGRNIPRLTADFAANDIKAGRLYDRLLIPESWVGLETLRQRLTRSMRTTLESYGQPMSHEHLEHSFQSMRHSGFLDFGNLPEDHQRQAINSLLDNTNPELVLVEVAGITQPLQDWLATTLAISEPTLSAQQLSHYSPHACLERLKSLYQRVDSAAALPPQHLPKQQVLAEFLKPGSFHFLCS